MRLFISENYIETFPKDNQFIWETINECGHPLFTREEVEYYWREFSTDVFSAGYMAPDLPTIKLFVSWLEDNDQQ